MPLPSKGQKEKKSKFMDRCVSDPKMKKEFSDIKQRIAVCISKYEEKSKAKTIKKGNYKGSPPKEQKKKTKKKRYVK